MNSDIKKIICRPNNGFSHALLKKLYMELSKHKPSSRIQTK